MLPYFLVFMFISTFTWLTLPYKKTRKTPNKDEFTWYHLNIILLIDIGITHLN